MTGGVKRVMTAPLVLMSVSGAASAGEPEVILGSYGRVESVTQLDGAAGEAMNLTAHPGRLNADPYLELDFGWRQATKDGATFTALVTPALSGDLFHYDGTFDAALAVRNLYVDADSVFTPGLGIWAGSRMLRGDDVYLLDFWPLDNLNTVGGGVRWTDVDTFVGAHVGMNRLAGENWQVQQIEAPTPGGVASQSVTVLDRQRVVGSFTASRVLHAGKISIRPKVHGELHAMPEGTQYLEDRLDTATAEALPAEHGSAVGAQLSVWGWAPDSFAHAYYRHATGIAALGELTVPTDGWALDGSVNGWRDDQWAVSANHQARHWSVTWGGTVRNYADADGNVVDFDDGWEWSSALRLGAYFARYGAVLVEADHQYKRPNGINPVTNTWDVPQVRELSLMPAVQFHPGAFSRPQIHLRYSLRLANQDALDWYSAYDTRARDKVEHVFGIGAEWWLNSQGYR